MQRVTDEQTTETAEQVITPALAWIRKGRYHSEALNGLYKVAAYKIGEGIIYRASKARQFIGNPVNSPDEAKRICQADFVATQQSPDQFD